MIYGKVAGLRSPESFRSPPLNSARLACLGSPLNGVWRIQDAKAGGGAQCCDALMPSDLWESLLSCSGCSFFAVGRHYPTHSNIWRDWLLAFALVILGSALAIAWLRTLVGRACEAPVSPRPTDELERRKNQAQFRDSPPAPSSQEAGGHSQR